MSAPDDYRCCPSVVMGTVAQLLLLMPYPG